MPSEDVKLVTTPKRFITAGERLIASRRLRDKQSTELESLRSQLAELRQKATLVRQLLVVTKHDMLANHPLVVAINNLATTIQSHPIQEVTEDE